MILKKSIRIAAVVVGLSVLLAGCGNGDDGENGGGSSLGGHVGTNPFKGLTLVYKNSYSEEIGEIETYSFISDTKGMYNYEWRNIEDRVSYQENFEYAVDSTRNMLKYRVTSHTENGETQTMDDTYLAGTFGNLDDKTKSLIYDALIEYVHYDFADDDTGVKLDSYYYFGSLTEHSASLAFCDATSRFDCSIDSNRMIFYLYRANNFSHYVCYPKFSDDGLFTAVAFQEYYDTDTYKELAVPLAGTCQITGIGTGCTGTVKFTQIPDEMLQTNKDDKGLELNKEYQLRGDTGGSRLYMFKK